MASGAQEESMLDLARRHVLDGRRIVAQQRLRIELLRAKGRDTNAAELTLEVFEKSQAIFEDHLRELEVES